VRWRERPRRPSRATLAISEFEQRANCYEHGPIPIIALIASAVGEGIDDALKARCDLHVAKPIKKLTLLTAIRDVMLKQPPEELRQLPAGLNKKFGSVAQ